MIKNLVRLGALPIVAFAMSIAPAYGSAGGFDGRWCANIFRAGLQDLTVKIIATDPSITDTQLRNVKIAKKKFDQGVLQDFAPTPGLTIEVGLDRAEPYQSILDNDLTFPYEFSNPIADAFQFTGEPLFAHEYTHAVLEPYFLKKIPRLASYLRFVDKYKTVNRIRQSTLDAFNLAPEEFPLLRAWRLLVTYNEFLANLGTVLIYDDPYLPSTVATSLYSLTGDEANYRSFAYEYQKELNTAHPTLGDRQNTLLGPAATFVWKLYLKNRATVPKHVFFKAVVRATTLVLSQRILNEHHLITQENVGELLSPGMTIQDVNDQLIRKLEAIDFKSEVR